MLDVLIVDDSVAIRKIMQRVLHQTQIPIGNIFEAGDGVEALNILKTETVGVALAGCGKRQF
jgi:two-component system chemotaxis response regulator CheY